MRIIYWVCISILLFWTWFGSLTITEVWFDGTDEWIEITNLWAEFSWDVNIIWAKSSSITINFTWFQENETRIVWDKLEKLELWNTIHILDQKLSIIDSKAWSIQLDVNWTIINSFSPTLEQVTKADKLKQTLQLFLDDSWEQIISNDFKNEWVFERTTVVLEGVDSGSDVDNIDDQNEEAIDVGTGSNGLTWSWSTSWSWSVMSWETNNELATNGEIDNVDEIWDEPGAEGDPEIEEVIDNNIEEEEEAIVDDNIGDEEEIIEEDIYLQFEWITIQEIHQSDTERYWEYIELLAHQKYEWLIIIDGLWQWWASKELDIDVSPGDRIIVTDKWDLLESNYVLSSISLTDGGEALVLRGQTGQVIDSIVYNEWNKGSSLYFDKKNNENQRIFWIIDTPTPGYHTSNIQHLLWHDDQLDCSILIQNNSSFYHTNSVNLISYIWWKEIQNSNKKYNCERNSPAWWFDEFESTKCNPSWFTFDKSGIHQVQLDVSSSDGRHCSTTLHINLAEKIDVPSCRQDYYEWLYNKRKDRYENECNESTTNKSRDPNNSSVSTINNENNFDWSVEKKTKLAKAVIETTMIQWDLKIEALLPNPDGADGEKEWIRLVNNWNIDIDRNWLIVNAGKRQRSIGVWTIKAWENIEYFWNLWLYNRDACIRLEHEWGKVFDTLCYPNPKTDEWYVPYLEWEEPIELEAFDWSFDINSWETQTCNNKTPKKIEKESSTKIQTIKANKALSFDGSISESAVLSAPKKSYIQNTLKIEWLLPNPKGADGELEWIKISNVGENIIDLANIRINAGKRNSLVGEQIIQAWEVLEIRNNLWLYNRPACILLESVDWDIYDEFCYPQPKDDQRYSKENNIPYNDIADTQRLSSIWLDIQPAQVCITSKDEEILCKAISYQKKYENEKEKRAKDKEKYTQTIFGLKEKQNTSNLENKLHKEFIYDTIDLLRSDWSPVYYDTNIAKNYANRKNLSTELKNWNQLIQFGSIDFSPKQITTALKVYNNELPLAEVEMDIVMEKLMNDTRNFMDTLKENLKVDQNNIPLVLKK